MIERVRQIDMRQIELMARAIAEAERGAAEGEVPVGAVVVGRGTDGADGVILAAAHNRPIALNDPTAHAEMLALRQAGAALGAYRLDGAALFVTLEPCVMCVGAMVHARIAELYFGARDENSTIESRCTAVSWSPNAPHCCGSPSAPAADSE